MRSLRLYNLMIIKNILAIFLILACCSSAYGQTDYFAFKTFAFKDGFHDFSFPIFYNAGDNLTVEKINQLLQLAELELLKGYETNNIFEKISVDPGTIYGGKVNIQFQILNNTDKCLSIKFHEMSLGATSASWDRYYNFNSGNGDQLQLQDLFTKTGFVQFKKLVLTKRTVAFKKELQKVNASWRDNLLPIIDRFETDDLSDFYIQKGTINIDGENLLTKHEKSENLNMLSTYNITEFQDYLNDYGKTIFAVNNADGRRFHSDSLPQLFEGTIGNLPILLILNYDYDNGIRGVYVYRKYGKGIYLEGKFEKQKLVLKEIADKTEENGYVEATFEGDKIFGTWSNKDRTKILKFAVTRK